MESIKTSGLVGGIELHASIVGHSKIDFDKRVINRELRKQARRVQRRSRRMVATRAISEAGQYPGKQSGALQKAIDIVRPFKSTAFWIKVEPTTAKIKQTGKIYYPAILHHGSKARNISPRGNYMADALDQESEVIRSGLQQALAEALIPR